METCALAIAVFRAVRTGIGGSIGLSRSARWWTGLVFEAPALGPALMIGGIVEIIFGVNAERRRPEAIARPLTFAILRISAGAATESVRA